MTNTASQRQVDYINRLKGERVWYEYDPEDTATNVVRAQDEPEAYAAGVLISVARDMWRQGKFDKMSASSVIEALLAAPEKPEDVDTAPAIDLCEKIERINSTGGAPEGMHKFGGVIFKVQKAARCRGRLYAKALVEDGNGGWTFEYAPGAIKNLSAATRLTLEEAKRFGMLYGTCCVCGRTLTNEESIAAGIGPICAGKF